MRIALMLGNKPAPEMLELARELQNRGHQVGLHDLTGISLADFGNGEIEKKFCEFDLVYYRTGFGDAGGLALLAILERRGISIVNKVRLIHPLCSNKIYQSIKATQLGLQVPPSLFGRFAPFAEIVRALGLPFILKAANGIMGEAVFLVPDEDKFHSCIDSINGDVLFQRYIENIGDYRVFTVGGNVYQIFKRVRNNSDFKNNMSQGAVGEKVTDTSLLAKLSDMALKITRALDIEIGGIDIIEDSRNGDLYFLEANVNPGWKGLDKTLGTNTASFIADYLEKKVTT